VAPPEPLYITKFPSVCITALCWPSLLVSLSPGFKVAAAVAVSPETPATAGGGTGAMGGGFPPCVPEGGGGVVGEGVPVGGGGGGGGGGDPPPYVTAAQIPTARHVTPTTIAKMTLGFGAILLYTWKLFILDQDDHLSCTTRGVLHGQAKSLRALGLEGRAVLVIVLESNILARHNLVVQDTGRRELSQTPTIGHAITL